MADGVLTVTYNKYNGRVKLSGIVVTDVIRGVLSKLGVDVKPGEMQGQIIDRRNWDASKRGVIVEQFNRKFDQDPNPYHATDNLTITFTEA
jgi:hypothetical protein